MANRKIVWSPAAKIEFIEILDYYLQRNQSIAYSEKLESQVKQTLAKLETNPFLGVKSQNDDIRVIIESAFLIFYSVTETQIQILSIIDSRQDPEKMPFEK
jgi:toxin YoeB